MTRKVKNWIVIFVGIIATLIFGVFIFNDPYTEIQPEDGVFNLSDWNNNGSMTFNLGGEWEFYWSQLLQYPEFEEKTGNYILTEVPHVWNDCEVDGKSVAGFGYGTYRIHVKNAVPGQEIGIRVSPMSTSYNMYIDDELLASSGIVGTSKEMAEAEYRIQAFSFVPESDSFDIILQVSNYTYARGGFWYALQFGEAENIISIDKFIFYRDIFLCGGFFALLLITLGVYLLRSKEKAYPYFIIIIVTIIGRIVIYGSYLLSYIDIPNQVPIFVRIDYLGVIWFSTSYILLIDTQFKGFVSKKLCNILLCISGLFTLLICFLPTLQVTYLTYAMQIYSFSIIFLSFGTIAYLVYKRQKYSIMSFIPSCIVVVCGLHDVFLQNNTISRSATEYSPYAFMIFIIFFNIIIASRYSDTLLENERRITEIKEVRAREQATEMKFLKSQIKPHFINNTLNAIISTSRVDPDKSRELLLEFSHYLRYCYDFEELDEFETLEKELNLVKSYVRIEKTRFEDRFTVAFDIGKEIDQKQIMIPPLFIQPLVENAITHGVRNVDRGKIIIYCMIDNDEIVIGVKDNGIGFIEGAKEKLLSDERKTTGVGIFNINMRLTRLYGKGLFIEPIKTGGTNVYMRIPIRQKEED